MCLHTVSVPELERLANLMDYFNEVQKIISRIMIEGYDQVHGQNVLTNREDIEDKLANILLQLGLMEFCKDLDQEKIQRLLDLRSETLHSILASQSQRPEVRVPRLYVV